MGDPVIDYENALALVYDAQALVVKALRANPSKEEERRLNRRLGRLRLEETDLTAMIDALDNESDPSIQPPTDAQVQEIASLSGQVENATQANINASAALVTAGNVLDLASALTA